MTHCIRILHITPHLGGGVGRALVSLARSDQLRPQAASVERRVLCLEQPEKSGASNQLAALGVTVKVCDRLDDVRHAVAGMDLVQFEVWNHPRLFAAWHALRGKSLRAVHWCHVSGLSFPRLPEALWHSGHPVALTAPCSLLGVSDGLRSARREGRVHVVSSAAGFEAWPRPNLHLVRRREGAEESDGLRLGYVGSLNLAKMHPRYVEWCAEALPGLGVRPAVEVLGDEVAPGLLARRCAALGHPGLIEARGFCPDVVRAMSQWDCFLYLLNPHHYGTAEIALMEAMASGLVPVVLPNPCEAAQVEHGVTGWHVDGASALRATLTRIRDTPDERRIMGEAASTRVREQYTTARLTRGFEAVYEQAMSGPARSWDPLPWMGSQPWQWFQSTLPEPSDYAPGNAPRVPAGHATHAHLERTKGSVLHFARVFPEDAVLQSWSRALDPATEPRATPSLAFA